MSEGATLHPFDMKTVVFAKHAQHVVLIHFPIALVMIGVLFDFVATINSRMIGTSVFSYRTEFSATTVSFTRFSP